MFLLATFPSQLGVLILSIPAGIIYSTMLTIPFLLMAKYHASGSVSFYNSSSYSMLYKNCFKLAAINDRKKGSSNCRGLGTDMAVLSSTQCISQVIYFY